jgi:hypothetical protein
MTVKSWPTKLYLGIAVVALAMWIVGVSGRTILSLAAVGFMVAMHAGGHGGHGGGSRGGRADHDHAAGHAGHTGRASSASSTGAPATDTDTDTRSEPRGGCH